MKILPRLTLVVVLSLSVFSSAKAQNTRQRQLLDSDWRFSLSTNSAGTGASGMPVTQWIWIADDNAPTDAATMAAPSLDTSSWTAVTVGTDVFGGRVGYAWFRASITNIASLVRPVTLHFVSVDDSAVVYLNGHRLGQHAGWSDPFDISLDPAWIANGTNVLAVAVQNTGGIGGIYGGVFVDSGPQVQPPGILVTQWLWLADDNAPNDAAAKTATNLDTSTWQTATIGQDLFNGHAGYAWFRTSLDALASAGRPLKLHFLCVDDNASIYLNGILIAQHAGASQPFDISPLDYAWVNGGPNILSIAVQNTSGSGGLAGPVSLECGSDIQPPGNPVTQWVWIADDNATNDAPAMTATNLNTASWQTAAIGQDVFGGRVGSVWFRSTLSSAGITDAPSAFHFLGVDDNATVYLNGTLIGQHAGASQAFDVAPQSAWVPGGLNVLAMAVQNTNGSGGILKPVLAQSVTANTAAPAAPDFNDTAWRTVHLPHDYIVEGTFTNTADAGHGSLPLSPAWYRKTFTVPASAQGQSIWIDFDGVYHNSKVWLNGNYLGNWWSGYAAFRYDISHFAIPGGTNVLAVYVDPSSSEGWWYEGGGIYRHVWLNIANPLHVAPWGTFVTSTVQGPDANGNASANLTVQTTITNTTGDAQPCTVVSQITGPDGVMAGTATTSLLVPAGASSNLTQMISVANARLWSLETPQLYQLHTVVQQNGQPIDNADTSFGIRSIRFDVNNGFFLNGKHVELNGTCNHQDFAGVGIGMPDNLLYWRIKKLKEMGSNAYRCSHNPPTEALLDACDRLGMLVMDETRHLGDATGTKSDASTPYSDLSELNSMILRDRNHPSIVIWSMCNEEFGVQATQAGANIFYAMKNRVHEFDTTRPISCAMNGGTGFGISLVEDLQGVNYNPGDYDPFHKSFPLQPMYASETTSATTDRGMYTNDSVNGYVSGYNTTAENSWKPVASRPFMAGGFVWTGFDYKGEPSPYGWPCVNSHFGIMDMCGLPKDSYYYYQAWWGNKPSAYIFPHWNWSTPGQPINVWCFANTDTAELFLNGVSQGAQTVPAYGHVAWSVPYAPGTLSVKGYIGGVPVVTNQVVTTGPAVSVRLTTDRTTLTADQEDLTVVYASLVDAQGLVVPTASNLVTFSVSGAGCVAGVGNGDPSSHEPDRAAQRHAFNGWCMALVGATNYAGAMTLTATSPGLTTGTLNLQAMAVTDPPAIPTGLSAMGGNASVKLNWQLSFGASNYNIKRATVSGGPYTTLSSYTAATFTDITATNGNTYYYVVSAVNTNGQSANSLEVSATPVASSALAAPTGLVALRDDGQAGLSWNSIAGATSYNIKRSTSSGGPFLTVASSAASSYTDPGLTNGLTYFYVVSAVANGLESPNSSQVSITPTTMSYLAGTITGTPGSWSNIGNTREKAFDGSVNSFFDAPTGNNNWVGLDLGTNAAKVISKISFYPRSGFAGRMTGGVFQGANASDFSDAVTFFTLTSQPPDGAWTTLLNSNLNTFRYVRYLSPANGFGNVAEVNFYTPGPAISFANGTTFGSVGSLTNTSDKVFDGDLTTFFDSSSANGNWIGVDFGYPRVITDVRYCPRSTFGSRMLNGVVQGANISNFSDLTNLFAITNTPPDITLTAQAVTDTNAFRYVRYLSPNISYGDVAELQFFSSTPAAAALPDVPTGLAATPGDALVGLSWTASSGAVTYNVKRASASGGPYTTLTNRPATVDMDSGLAAGTYYYVVSAVNSAGESADSAEVSAQLTCSPPTAPTGLAVSAENGQLTLAWSALEGVSSYNILRATNSQGPFLVLVAGVNGVSYTDTTVTNKLIYYYTVQAVNACGPSTNSIPDSVTDRRG
jgi:beta-galactosidase